MSRPLRVLLAAGGTSGHVHPAIAVAEALRARMPDAAILFAGTADKLESRVVPAAGFDFRSLRARGFPRRPSLDTLRAVRVLLQGRRDAIALIRAFAPDVVLGTGGYVCGPVVFAAARLGVPVVLHEQNAFPGRANRLLSRRAHTVCLSFPDSAGRFPRRVRTAMTGYPVRPAFFHADRDEARARLGLPTDAPFVLAFGGSLGARTINRAVLSLLKEGPAPLGARFLLATGATLRDEARAEAAALPPGAALDLAEYIEEPQVAMAAADLVVGRAGAGTCAEIAALGKPSVLVPYPFAPNDHQTYNARSLADAGAAVLVPDAEFDAARLRALLGDLLTDRRRMLRMAAAAKSLAREDCADRIVDRLLEAAGRGGAEEAGQEGAR